MRLGNDWRRFRNFEVVLNSKHWKVDEYSYGYMVRVWDEDGDETEEDASSKFYAQLTGGNSHDQDVLTFCEGFKSAVEDIDTVFYVR